MSYANYLKGLREDPLHKAMDRRDEDGNLMGIPGGSFVRIRYPSGEVIATGRYDENGKQIKEDKP